MDETPYNNCIQEYDEAKKPDNKNIKLENC